MKTTDYLLVIVGFLIFLLVFSAGRSRGQPPEYNATDSAEWMREAEFSFSLSRADDVNQLSKIYQIGVLEATLALEKLSRKEHTKYDDEPKRAARVLLMFKGGGPRGVAALCDNITLPFGGGEEAVPLDNYFIAQGLAGIGGRGAREGLFHSLRQTLDRKGLLVRAHVLAEMEPPTVMREHLRLAIADQEGRERISAIPINEIYKGNLRRMDEWLKDPTFLADLNNWP